MALRWGDMMRKATTGCRLLAALLCAIAALPTQACSSKAAGGIPTLTETDVAAIHATVEAYRQSWLAGDAEGVLRTFTEDAVLLPHHGDPPVVGIAAIRSYWFAPGGPPTTITELALTIEQTSGNAGLAFVRGRDSVAWTVSRGGRITRSSNAGTYLNVMKKMPDGSWRIQAHMWDDPPNR